MKICVLGAGVIGVSTAYMLARHGHEVIVIDKGTDVASGASHANGAQLSYSHIDPLASPASLKKLPGYLLGTDPAIQLRMSLSPRYLSWGWRFLRECSAARFDRNFKARSELAAISRTALAKIEAELPQGALKRTGHGKIVLAHSEPEARNMSQDLQGQKFLTQSECIEVEPALKDWQVPFFGGRYAADDSALDPLIYCRGLRKACENQFGVRFCFEETIARVQTSHGRVTGVETDRDIHDCGGVIVCLGNDTGAVLKPLGINVPIYPMQGYSLTLPAVSTSPKASITDLKNKIVFANLGDKIRIAGFVDANQNPKNAATRIEQLRDTANANWPSAADYDGEISSWTHYRPMTPSGVPLIGPTKLEGLYINTGHGSLGYTFAAGSAMRIATAIGHTQKNSKVVKGAQIHAYRS